MSKITKLKPCPFCGEKPILHQYPDMDGVDVYYITCMQDGCLISPYTRYWSSDEQETAIKAWNTRYDNK